MPGNKNSGRPGGNPDIRRIKKTGPKTAEGKFKALIRCGAFGTRTNSKLLDMFKFCDKCPLGPKEVEKYNHKTAEYLKYKIPAKCLSHNPGGKCTYDQGEFVSKMNFYYKITEEMDTVHLQKALNLSMLENAELAKRAELMTRGRPGKHTAKFEELASKNLDSVNKQIYGEKHQNLNVNVDISDDIDAVWDKRMKTIKAENQEETDDIEDGDDDEYEESK